MVGVAVIGLMMSAGIVAFTTVQRSARDSRRRADIDAISKAMEQYYLENLQYPQMAGAYSNYSGLQPLIGQYFPGQIVPFEPNPASLHVYLVQSVSINNGYNFPTGYCISVRLESSTGNCNGGGTGAQGGGGITGPWAVGGTYGCNFNPSGTGQYYCAESRQGSW